MRFGASSFAIFDAFPEDAAREAHLSGEVAGSLMEKAPQLLASDPTIERAVMRELLAILVATRLALVAAFVTMVLVP